VSKVEVSIEGSKFVPLPKVETVDDAIWRLHASLISFLRKHKMLLPPKLRKFLSRVKHRWMVVIYDERECADWRRERDKEHSFRVLTTIRGNGEEKKVCWHILTE